MKNVHRSGRFLSLPAAAITAAVFHVAYAGAALPAPPSDVNLVLQRATEEARQLPTSQSPAAARAAIEPLLASLSPQGTWPDIKYSDHGQGVWSPTQHLPRVLRMAVAYQTPGADNPQYHAPELKSAILKAYDGWFTVLPPGTPPAKTQTKIMDTRVTPTSTNWWHNEIGVQLNLGPILLLMRNDLSPSQMAEGLDILARSWTPSDISYKNQAANLSWRSRITTWRACLQNNPALIADISRRIAAEAAITDKEGLQADYSFWQHGPQLYSLGYGRGFSLDMTSLATLYADTPFAFGPDVLDNISHHILDGQQWMMRGDTLDNSARGREIVRKGAGVDRQITVACDRMIALHAPRAKEFAAFRARIAGEPAAPSLTGNRAFWRSDFMSQQRPGYYASVRATSQNLRGAEFGNSEGAHSYYTGDGVNFLYRTGAEYDNIAPVWDWTRLPGVTCPHSALPPKIPGSNTSGYNWGVGGYAGGVSDGTFGATVYDYARDGLSARKAWFFFDREYVCLGANITTDASAVSDPITTSINQCWLNGDVVARSRGNDSSGSPRTLTADSKEQRISRPVWVFHDSVGYVFPSSEQGQQNVVVKAGPQSGRWADVSLETSNKETVTKAVFGLWIEHGPHPKNENYAYVVAPGVDVKELDAYAARLPIIILSNTPTVQAVYHRDLKLVEAGFYAPGNVTLPDGETLAVSAPCVVLAREIGPGQYRISVADPHQVRGRAWVGGELQFAAKADPPLPHEVIRVTLSSPGAGSSHLQNITADFSLPSGLNMGQTVTKTVSAGVKNP